jgi:hypothetical protein
VNIKLLNGLVILEDKMPEIVDLKSDDVEFKISNYSTLEGKLLLRIEYNGTHSVYEVFDGVVKVPVNVLTKDITEFAFTLNGKTNSRRYVAPIDKVRVKGIINIKDGDDILELLRVLYNKYVELENKYDSLDRKVNEGDLLI